VLGLVDLSPALQTLLEQNPDSLAIERFGFGDKRVVTVDKLDTLGENRVDRHRAAVREDIGVGYDLALAILNGDV
jgi:hypothetical protein